MKDTFREQFENVQIPIHMAVLEPHISVTRLGDLLHFGQLFKAFNNNYFAQIAHIFKQFL